MIHIALDREDIILIQQALRDLQWHHTQVLSATRKTAAGQHTKDELERIKSLLTRLHPHELKDTATP